MKLTAEIIDHLQEKGVPAATLSKGETLTVYLLSESKPFIGKFVLDMIYSSPLKGREPSTFTLERIDQKTLLTKVTFDHPTPELKAVMEGLLPQLEWGAVSFYQANRVLEMNLLSLDQKKERIQDTILYSIRRFPSLFDYDLFAQMQQFFLNLQSRYFFPRSASEVAQTIRALYYLKKKLLKKREEKKKIRHVFVKVLPHHLQLPFEDKQGARVIVAISALKENEVFKERHLLKAIQNILPDARAIEGSKYIDQEVESPLHLLTIEIEEKGGFEKGELADLRRWLPRTLKGKVEHLQRTLFKPRNEEEIMRHVITLGKELKFARDLPQLILSFEKQTETKLVFTVILARILHQDAPPLEDVLLSSTLRPKIDRVKQLGMIRKKYPKEAAVFTVELPLQQFLREDHSIDLYKARETILQKVRSLFGPLRDYNGGIISKQNEVFLALESLLGETAHTHHLLLENFFHSLFPHEKRSLLDPKLLKELFELLLDVMSSKESYLSKEKGETFMIIGDGDAIRPLSNLTTPLITLDLSDEGRRFMGWISHL